MAALRHSGTEYEGNGIAAIREAMAHGVRLPLATFAVIEHIADVVPPKLVGIYVIFDDHGGIISVYPHAHCPARLCSAIGVDLQAVGFKRKNYGVFGGWELKVERVYRNPRNARRATF